MQDHGAWESTHHRCATPVKNEIRAMEAGQGSVWVCHCQARWRLVLNVGRASWFNLGNEDKVYVGRL